MWAGTPQKELQEVEEMNNNSSAKGLSTIGVIMGVVLMIFGIISIVTVPNHDMFIYHGHKNGSMNFYGADFYTDEYAATKRSTKQCLRSRGDLGRLL